MATQRGLVIESDDGWAQIVAERRDACGGCSSNNNCRACLTPSKFLIQLFLECCLDINFS